MASFTVERGIDGQPTSRTAGGFVIVPGDVSETVLNTAHPQSPDPVTVAPGASDLVHESGNHSIFDETIEADIATAKRVRRSARLVDARPHQSVTIRYSGRGGAIHDGQAEHATVTLREWQVPSGGSTYADTELSLATQCWFCRQGGYVALCEQCSLTAGCITRNGVRGCFPDCQTWTCPSCYERAGLSPPYVVPLCAVGVGEQGMSNTPVALYQLYCEDDERFNVHRSSTSILENMLRSRFISRESGLLVLNRGFHDLADRRVVADLKRHRLALEDFAGSRPCDLIMVLNTHASSSHGGLLYGHGKSTGLPTMLDHVLGTTVPVELFRKSILFVVACGGFIEHSMEELRVMSSKFSVAIAFDAPSLDPILVVSQFVTSVVDYYVLGQEDLWPAIRYALKQEIMKHTSICVGEKGHIYRVSDAPLRRKPNGEEVRCCRHIAKYTGCDGQFITFRCRVKDHPGPRNFRVKLHLAAPGFREIWGHRGGQRYIVVKI
ncbi:hypothetical protein C8T65DRAFT_643740 [Cerioporus squamosus]|nr:hypothetical protein C8T65DRAFT_643740 [Cerioporus squamosus]